MVEYLDEFCRLANLENLESVAQRIHIYSYGAIFNNIARRYPDEAIIVMKKYDIYVDDTYWRNKSKKLHNVMPQRKWDGPNLPMIRHVMKTSKEHPTTLKYFSYYIIPAQNSIYLVVYLIKNNIITHYKSEIIQKSKKYVKRPEHANIFYDIINDINYDMGWGIYLQCFIFDVTR